MRNLLVLNMPSMIINLKFLWLVERKIGSWQKRVTKIKKSINKDTAEALSENAGAWFSFPRSIKVCKTCISYQKENERRSRTWPKLTLNKLTKSNVSFYRVFSSGANMFHVKHCINQFKERVLPPVTRFMGTISVFLANQFNEYQKNDGNKGKIRKCKVWSAGNRTGSKSL